MRGAIPGREPHLFRKKRAKKIPRKRWRHIKTHNSNAVKNIYFPMTQVTFLESPH